MQARCCPLVILIISLLVCSTADEKLSRKLVKRQVPQRSGSERAFPLSRSRQFPPPEELEESEEYDTIEEDNPKIPASPFRGRQPPPSDDYSDEQTVTEAPKITTPTPQKSTSRPNMFNNRNSRPKFGIQFSSKPDSTTPAPKPSTASSSNPRFRATPAQSQRLDVVADILNKPPPQRSSSRAISPSRTANENSNQKPTPKSPVASDQASRRSENTGGSRFRMRGRPRARSTTTTTTTTQALPEEYYYYYEDDDEATKNQPIATTTSTTTTTTTPRPSIPKRPSFNNRRPTSDRNSRSTTRPVIKFDPDSQFVPPPEKPVDIIKPSNTRQTSNRNSKPTSRPVIKFDPDSQFVPPPEKPLDSQPSTTATKRFTTSTTTEPPGGFGDIPLHLRHKYRPRADGRFIDFLGDPNRPRELKGHDLTDYPFYIRVPEDIVFDCGDKKDGYYASIPHKCQLFHYCFAGARYDFLCANYTLYDQTTFTCRFAINVDCLSSEKYYYRNDDLWKETTTVAPETTTKKKRPRPRDYDYDDEYDSEDYEDEEEDRGRRRRPARRRRNRRKNKRKQQDDEEE